MIDEAEGATAPVSGAVLAVLAGCAVIVGAALLVPMLLPPKPLAVLLQSGAVLGLGLWLIALFTAMRRASIAAKLGGMAILIGLGLVAGWVTNNRYQARWSEDASSFAEVEFGPQGVPQLPAGAAARGPLSRQFAEMIAADMQAAREGQAALGKLGAGALNSPYQLQQSPAVLRHCDALKGAADAARTRAEQRHARHQALAAAIAAAGLPTPVSEGMTAMVEPTGTSDPLLDNAVANIGETEALCALLARHSWFNDNYVFGFRDPADRAQFKALTARRLALAGQAAQIGRAATARMESGREKVREALR
jgi:hypothetical protein